MAHERPRFIAPRFWHPSPVSEESALRIMRAAASEATHHEISLNVLPPFFVSASARFPPGLYPLVDALHDVTRPGTPDERMILRATEADVGAALGSFLHVLACAMTARDASR